MSAEASSKPQVESVKPGFLASPDDLNHLVNVQAEEVESFLQKLNALDEKTLKGRKPVAVIGTGGTISMKVENGIRLPDLDFENIFKKTNSGLADKFYCISLDAFRIDSSQMNFTHVMDIAIITAYVWHNLKCEVAGFLVPHGTDTMAYSAATLSLVMGQGLPFSIVYTGAQKSIQEPMNDAGINLRNALFTLEALHAEDKAEVVIVMGNKAILGTSAMKVDDTMINAFDAPLHRYVTSFSALEYPVRIADWLNPRRYETDFQPTLWDDPYSHTLVVNSSLGLNPELVLRQTQDPLVHAILLFSYGGGTIYEKLIDAIIPSAKEKNMPIFIISPVNAEYKVAYESGDKAIKKGVVPLFMTLPAALAKIEIALRKYPGDPKAQAKFVATDYVGEIPSEKSRFSPVLKR